MTDIPIRTQFAFFEPFLIGEPRQFLVQQGETYCVRAHPEDLDGKNPALNPCLGCPYFEAGCEIAEERAIEGTFPTPDGGVTGIEPHSRRGIGFEERGFLILLFREGHSHATMPRELWDNPYADKAMYEANLHFVLTDPRRAKFHTIKGQLRYYGTEAEFLTSPYAEYLRVFDVYDPVHTPTSLDFSAIEPRVSTLVSREPEWMKVFQGTPKAIAREVEFTARPNATAPSVYEAPDGRAYCYLNDEMDKASFESQCQTCPVASVCRPKTDYVKNVADDWHGKNAAGLYGSLFTDATDKYLKKDLRSISKVVGLALCYGGTAYTVHKTMRSTEDEAQKRIDNFFATLVVLNSYMQSVRSTVRERGVVMNRFGRRRDVTRWSHSQAMMPLLDVAGNPVIGEDGQPVLVPNRKQRFKDAGFAERTGLNYPIQSTAAEIIKMAKIRVDELIQENGWNPLAGMAPPPRINLRRGAYRDLVFALLSTIHDELLYMIREDVFAEVIPQVYKSMQLDDIMAAMHTGYSLEMDCEFDRTRSWTASEKYHTARIYLLNHLRGESGSHIEERPVFGPNMAILRLAECPIEFANACDSYVPPGDASDGFRVALEMPDGSRVLHPHTFSRSFVEQAAARTGARIDLAVM